RLGRPAHPVRLMMTRYLQLLSPRRLFPGGLFPGGTRRANQFGPLAWIGAGIVALVVLTALFAPLLAPYELNYLDMTRQLEGHSRDHWLGTDENGADILT